MRKINAILTIIILALFIDHAVFGTLNTLGKAQVVLPVARMMTVCMILHAIISIILTVKSEMVTFKTKTAYNKENREYWLRRWTGVLILIFFVTHVAAMKKQKGQLFKIASSNPFGKISFILFVASIAAHVVINIRPLLISMGVRNRRTVSAILNILYVVICAGAAVACALTVIGGGK